MFMLLILPILRAGIPLLGELSMPLSRWLTN